MRVSVIIPTTCELRRQASLLRAIQSLHAQQGIDVDVIVVVNGNRYLAANFAYTSVSMVGISAGGWVTTLAAAVDTRIVKSFPVAGSYPIYLRSNSQRDWDD